jgi:response regulator RpfG family c-di-GMP phosphodiesterase
MLSDLVIYYVDDDPEDLDVFAEVAISMDVEVIPINESDDVKRKILLPHDGVKILFLDVNMPIKSGYEVLEEFKRTESLNHFPIVTFSTGHDSETIKKCWDLGADLFIQKGNSLDRYKEILRQVKTIDWRSFKRTQEKFVLNPS